MFNLVKVALAWKKVLLKITTKEHRRRAKICEQCPLREFNKYVDFIDDELKEVKGFICGDCGCPLIAKIRSNDICKKWETPTN